MPPPIIIILYYSQFYQGDDMNNYYTNITDNCSVLIWYLFDNKCYKEFGTTKTITICDIVHNINNVKNFCIPDEILNSESKLYDYISNLFERLTMSGAIEKIGFIDYTLSRHTVENLSFRQY